MKITEQEVRYVAGLANLSLTNEEVVALRADLDEILTHVEKLNELNTDHVEPMAQVVFNCGETATLREDRERPVLGTKVALSNSPADNPEYFKVPRVIER